MIIFVILHHFISINSIAIIGISFGLSVGLAFSNGIMKFYGRIESNFMKNLNKRQEQASFVIPEVLQQNFHLEKLTVSQNSQVVGKMLKDTVFRSKYNVSVVSIERGNSTYDLPDINTVFYPYDIITIVGNDENINKIKPIIEVEDTVLIRERDNHDMRLHSIRVAATNSICGITLRNSKFKDKYNAMVIAIQRGEDFILNPSASFVFQNDDIIWFVSSDEAYAELKQHEHVTQHA